MLNYSNTNDLVLNKSLVSIFQMLRQALAQRNVQSFMMVLGCLTIDVKSRNFVSDETLYV